MRKPTLFVSFILLVSIAAILAQGQMLQSIVGSKTPAGGGSGTFSIVQHTVNDHPSGCAGQLSCATTITATGAGNTLAIMAHTFSASGEAVFSANASVTGSAGGTWVNDTNCSAHTHPSNFYDNHCIYNLAPTTGTTSLTVTFSAVDSFAPAQWAIDVWEIHWTGSSITYQTGASSGSTVESCTSSTCAGVSVGTLTGSNVIIQSLQITDNAVTAITGGAGYTTYQDFFASYGSGFAAAINTSTGTAPTWTDTTPDNGIANAIVFKGNP